MNLDHGLDVLIALGERGALVPPLLTRVRPGGIPDLSTDTVHGYSAYVGLAQGWDNASVFLAKVATATGFSVHSDSLLKKRHGMNAREVCGFVENSWQTVTEEAARLGSKVPLLNSRSIRGHLYASWLPQEARFSFIAQVTDAYLHVWLDFGNSDGWQFHSRASIKQERDQITYLGDLDDDSELKHVPVDAIVQACQAVARHATVDPVSRNLVIEGKVMHDHDRVMLIDVYEGPPNPTRAPVTHAGHLALLGLPARESWWPDPARRQRRYGT